MSVKTCDVVIVGAGLSGLSAAQQLKKRNATLNLLILEGKDRVGGRTLTSKVPAAQGEDLWDFGGQWVGSTQTHVMDLIGDLGLEVYPQYTAGKKVHHMGGPNGKIRTYTSSIPTLSPLVLLDLMQFLWKINRLTRKVSVEDPVAVEGAVEFDSMTLHTYMEKHVWTRVLKEEMGLFSRTVFGMEPSQMSFLFFLMYSASAGGVLRLMETTPGSAQEFRVKGGTQQLCERLADQIGGENILLDCAVTGIQLHLDHVEVKTSNDTYVCKAVIISCPPHLTARIQFEPTLPLERKRLTESMPVGHLVKFLVTYTTAFWRTKGFSGEIVAQPTRDCPLGVTFDATSPDGNPALVGFIAGLQASEWSHRRLEERRDAVIRSLVKYLGPEASGFIHYAEKDWAKEEYNGGCPVSVMTPGMLTYLHQSLRKPFGRVHWAGTETATHWCGYLSGAVQAGQRAALEVLGQLSPHNLSSEEQETVRAAQTGPAPLWTRDPVPAPFRVSVRMVVTMVTLGAVLLLAKSRICHRMK